MSQGQSYLQQEYLRSLASQAAGYGNYYQEQPQDIRYLEPRLQQDARYLQQDLRSTQVAQDIRFQDPRYPPPSDRRLLNEIRTDQRLISETDRRLLADLREKRALTDTERRLISDLESRGIPPLPEVYRNPGFERRLSSNLSVNIHEQKVDFTTTTSMDISLPIQIGLNILKVIINVKQEAPVSPYLILKYSTADALSVSIVSANITATEVPENVALALTSGSIMATVTPGRSYLLSLVYFV
jgi:hypothetical protein